MLSTPAVGWAQPAAAPPTAAGNTGLSVRPGVEVFAQYAVRSIGAGDGTLAWSHGFEVPRVHAALTGEFGDARARIVLEGASPTLGAAGGIAGPDTFLFRLREAYAGWSPGRTVRVQMGVVPTLTVPEIEGTWRLRVVAPTTLEQSGLGSPADLGATVRVNLPGTFGWLGVGAYNGDGYNGRALNRGRNVEVAATVHPIQQRSIAPLAVFASVLVGSAGAASTRSDRFTAGLLWQGPELRAGAVGTIAWGVDGDRDRLSYVLDLFTRFEPHPRLLVGLRYSFLQRDNRLDSGQVHTVLGTVGYRVVEPLEVFAAVSRAVAAPDGDQWELRIVSRGVY